MRVVYLALFICLTVAPILLAWLKGDRILDVLARRRRIRRRIRRRRATRSLPVKADVLENLLKAEDARDSLEEQIGAALARFRSLPIPRSASPEREDLLQDTAQLLLTRESRFGRFLDLAWLQSETIEVLSDEVRALRQVAGIQEGAFGTAAGPRSPEARPDAAQQLLQNLDAAAGRRQQVDRRIRSIRSRRPDGGQAARFDATVE